MNLIEQVFKIQMGTRFHLLININQPVASVVEGVTVEGATRTQRRETGSDGRILLSKVLNARQPIIDNAVFS